MKEIFPLNTASSPTKSRSAPGRIPEPLTKQAKQIMGNSPDIRNMFKHAEWP